MNIEVALQHYAVNDGGCWMWLGHKQDGYGHLQIGNRSDEVGFVRARYAHCLFYEVHRGAVPEGLELDHLCRNRACVNPEHLEAVTHKVNVRRGDTHLNARKAWGISSANKLARTKCRHGHPYDMFNTYIRPDGYRDCHTCRALATQRSKKKKTEVVL